MCRMRALQRGVLHEVNHGAVIKHTKTVLLGFPFTVTRCSDYWHNRG